MKFPNEDLVELAYDMAPDGYRVVSNILTDNSRWSLHYELIFEHGGKFWKTAYTKGHQDGEPFGDEPDMVKCREVEPYQETVTKYRAVTKV